MRAVIQRVRRASVTIEGKISAEIACGLLVLLGIEEADSAEDISWLAKKIVQLRIFDDKEGIMNHSVSDCSGDIIVVSQFTLHAKTRKGNRPSYIKAAAPEIAVRLYKSFIAETEKELGKKVGSGQFGAMMEVELINDGPVTILIDTKNRE